MYTSVKAGPVPRGGGNTHEEPTIFTHHNAHDITGAFVNGIDTHKIAQSNNHLLHDHIALVRSVDRKLDATQDMISEHVLGSRTGVSQGAHVERIDADLRSTKADITSIKADVREMQSMLRDILAALKPANTRRPSEITPAD